MVPILLRKVCVDADEQYKLVGECHCQGLRPGDEAAPTAGLEEMIELH
jgi:hypothetical protein